MNGPEHLAGAALALPPEGSPSDALSALKSELRDASMRGLEAVAVRAADLRLALDALADDTLLASDRRDADGGLENARQRGGSHALISIDALAAICGAARRGSEPVTA